ncbi:hypothetical protein [Celeribacter persicus]|uniref:Uncharacterized protein n=1 Tax=Celeribacter persicus TaxID=1651082 RepID=A0A2T5H9Q2_9RHOB|nr:hypothetical protein [Celeribacter persicus]PTQ68318.1 hypothetical protein C8N42_11530 [Celeribacter persicus]
MSKPQRLILHLSAFVLCLLFSAALATWRGALWPFDPKATALMTVSGLASVFSGWGPVWIIPLVLSVAVNRMVWRLALWIITVVAMIGMHGTLGPAQGFAPLTRLTVPSAVLLYAVPTAMCLLLGSLIRLTMSRSTEFN